MNRRWHYLPLCILLSACTAYAPLTLEADGKPTMSLERLKVDAGSMPFRSLAAHVFDASDGLDMVEVAMLAVVNNPDLRLARDDAAIAHAQAFSAGLLPDPQLALSHDLSNTAGVGATRAFSFGLSYDIATLLTHSSLQGAATADANKSDLTLLWQEWQVAAQAQLLFVKLSCSQKMMVALTDAVALSRVRLEKTRAALERGLLGGEIVLLNQASLQDTERQIFDLTRQINQNVHDLNALLGLPPETIFTLQSDAEPGAIDTASIVAAAADLPRRRPDLLALQAGYRAQDDRYRAALLAQFPALNVGLTRARDSSGIDSHAVGINLTLPFLNRNRGNIAIEKASRQKLFDEYQMRLQISRNDAHRLMREQALMMAQLAAVDVAVADLEAALARGRSAFNAGNADFLVFSSAQSSLLAKQIERIGMQQAVLEQRIGLKAVLGLDLINLPSFESHKQ